MKPVMSSIIRSNFVHSPFNEYTLCCGPCKFDGPMNSGFTSCLISTPYYLLQYISSGSGTMIIDDVPFDLTAGDLVLIFPNQSWVERASSDDPWSFLWFEFSGSTADSFAADSKFTRASPIIHDCSNTRIPIIFNEMHKENKINQNRFFAKPAKVYELLDEIIMYRSLISTTKEHEQPYNMYIEQALYYVKENYQQKSMTIDSIASALNVHRCHLYRIFKAVLNTTPQQYIVNYRIDKACSLLATPDIPILEVAKAVGYDPAIFPRVFKRITGMTPSDYRTTYYSTAIGKRNKFKSTRNQS